MAIEIHGALSSKHIHYLFIALSLTLCVWSESRSDIYNNSLYIYEIWLNETWFAY